MDVSGVSGPAKPEQTGGKRDATGHHMGETPFRDGDIVVCSQFPRIPRLGQNDGQAAEHLTHDHAEIGEASDALAKTMHALEDHGVCGHEEIENAVYKGGIDADERDDGLGE